MELIITITIVMVTCTTLFSHCSAQISQVELGIKELNTKNVVQSSRIDPSRVVPLSWQPRVFAYRGLISNEECDHLISLAHKNKEDTTQGLSKGALFTSNVKDDMVARIEDKISAWTLLPPENSQPIQIWHYQNEETKQKYDYFGNKSAWEVSEPLMATVVLYLSNMSRGGEISFPESRRKASGLKRKMWEQTSEHYRVRTPIKGNAILFFNSHLNASPDESSRHERGPVVEGEMWCATKFIHMRPIGGVRKVKPESENDECTDEDDNCPQWAALGECEKNPNFMVGSPDYYGACRKSCNVCADAITI